MTPARTDSISRIIRTVFAVLAALAGIIPLLTTIPGVSTTLAAEVGGIAGAVFVVVTAVINIAEEAGIMPAMLRDLPLLPDETAAAPAAVVADVKAVAALAETVVAATKASKVAKS